MSESEKIYAFLVTFVIYAVSLMNYIFSKTCTEITFSALLFVLTLFSIILVAIPFCDCQGSAFKQPCSHAKYSLQLGLLMIAQYAMFYNYCFFFDSRPLCSSLITQSTFLLTMLVGTAPTVKISQSPQENDDSEWLLEDKEKHCILQQATFIVIGNAIVAIITKYAQLTIFPSVLWTLFAGFVTFQRRKNFSSTRSLKVWMLLSVFVSVIYPLGINKYPLATSLLSDGFLAFGTLLFMANKQS